jgi:hypothetical protein
VFPGSTWIKNILPQGVIAQGCSSHELQPGEVKRSGKSGKRKISQNNKK